MARASVNAQGIVNPVYRAIICRQCGSAGISVTSMGYYGQGAVTGCDCSPSMKDERQIASTVKRIEWGDDVD